jgi:hypothetical protein
MKLYKIIFIFCCLSILTGCELSPTLNTKTLNIFNLYLSLFRALKSNYSIDLFLEFESYI